MYDGFKDMYLSLGGYVEEYGTKVCYRSRNQIIFLPYTVNSINIFFEEILNEDIF